MESRRLEIATDPFQVGFGRSLTMTSAHGNATLAVFEDGHTVVGDGARIEAFGEGYIHPPLVRVRPSRHVTRVLTIEDPLT